MHIPDGYLSPSSCVAGFAAATPVWMAAMRKAKRRMKAATAPRLGVFAAFSFVLMMFNVPLPGGSSGHAVGGALMALVLGPWEAVLGVSAALVIQALFFGDGGIGALGANCVNMAMVLPFMAYGVFHALRRSGMGGAWAAGLAGWFGLVTSALCAGIELGVQPLLFHDAAGRPVYAPYGLSTTVPVMVGSHALVAGVVEGVVTALVWSYLHRAQPGTLQGREGTEGRFRLWPALVALLALALAAPVGLLTSSTAFAEWGGDELKHRLGYVPAGLARMANARPAAWLDGYGVHGLSERAGYVVAALVGITLLLALSGLLNLVLRRSAPVEDRAETH